MAHRRCSDDHRRSFNQHGGTKGCQRLNHFDDVTKSRDYSRNDADRMINPRLQVNRWDKNLRDIARTNSDSFSNWFDNYHNEHDIITNKPSCSSSHVHAPIVHHHQPHVRHEPIIQKQQPRIRNNKSHKSLQTDVSEDGFNVASHHQRQHCRKKFNKSRQTDSFGGDGFNVASHVDVIEGGGTQKYEHGHDQPLKINDLKGVQNHTDGNWNYTEEDLIRSSQIYDGSPTYVHGNWKWRLDEPLEENDNYEGGEITNHYLTNLDDAQTEYLTETEDVMDEQIGTEDVMNDDRTETEDVMDDDDPTETEEDVITQIPDNTLDEPTETSLTSESCRPVLRIFREINPNRDTYRLYFCLPLSEGEGYEDSRRFASEINENIDDYWIEEGNEEEDDNSGLSEEAISQQLRTRIYRKSVNREEDNAEEGAICVICLNHYEDGETQGSLACGHEYHVDCIKKWLLLKNKCPLCKYTVSLEDVI